MKRLTLLFIAASLIVAAGCGKTSDTLASKGPEATKASDITGKWSGKIEMPQGKSDDPMAKMGEAMMGMLTGNLNLEFLPGDRFRLSMMGVPVEGSVQREGAKLTLTSESAMGMPIEEAKKSNPNFSQEKLFATVSDDGAKITVLGKDAKPEEGQMVFTRAKEEPEKKAGPSSVKPEEEPLVGSYSAQLIGDKPAGMKQEEETEWKMAEAMLTSSTLDLYQDNTCKMNLMFQMEGTWKVEGGTVKIHMTKMLGMPDSGKSSTGEDMVLKIENDGRQLMNDKAGPGGAKMAFVRK